MSEYKLFERITALSESDNWEDARKEWQHIDTYYVDGDKEEANYETCLCTHYPIAECCVIENQLNGNRTIVGNCCIKKFMNLDFDSDALFNTIRKVLGDIKKPFSLGAVEYAYSRDIIDSTEYSFYVSTRRKRKLSEYQIFDRILINDKILSKLVKNRALVYLDPSTASYEELEKKLTPAQMEAYYKVLTPVAWGDFDVVRRSFLTRALMNNIVTAEA